MSDPIVTRAAKLLAAMEDETRRIHQRRIRTLEARILELERQLAQPKHQRWQAPINRETP